MFDTYAAEWLESRRSRISVASFKAWEGSLKNHILPRLGGKALTAIRPSDIEYALARMTCGPATLRDAHQDSVLRPGDVPEDALLLVRNLRARCARWAGRLEPGPLGSS